jgi:hypothetical protein
MAIVYFHRRKDTNEVFYVGIGKNKRRATDKSNRNEWWHNVVNKHGYVVEIVHTELTEEQSKLYETKYINQFGRKDLGLGELVNLTDGGEGRKNYQFSDDSREQMSQIHTKKSGHKIYIYNVYTEDVLFFESKRVACKHLKNIGVITQRKTLKDKTFLHNGEYLISNTELTQEEKVNLLKQSKQVKLKVIQLDKHFNIVNEFESLRDAVRNYGVCVSSVLDSKKIHKSAFGYYWIYKHEFLSMSKDDLVKRFTIKSKPILLTQNDLKYIRINPDNLTVKELTKKFNCSNGTIYNVKHYLGKFKNTQ